MTERASCDPSDRSKSWESQGLVSKTRREDLEARRVLILKYVSLERKEIREGIESLDSDVHIGEVSFEDVGGGLVDLLDEGSESSGEREVEGLAKTLRELGRDDEGFDAGPLRLVLGETNNLRDEFGEVGLVDGDRVGSEELAEEREGFGGERSGVGGSGGREGIGDSSADDDGLGFKASSKDGDEFSKEDESSLLGRERLGSELLEGLLEETGNLRLEERERTS